MNWIANFKGTNIMAGTTTNANIFPNTSGGSGGSGGTISVIPHTINFQPYGSSVNISGKSAAPHVCFSLTSPTTGKKLLEIFSDGTIGQFEPGTDKAVADQFYKVLQMEGRNLHNEIKALKDKVEYASKVLDEFSTIILDTDKSTKAQYIKEKSVKAMEILK